MRLTHRLNRPLTALAAVILLGSVRAAADGDLNLLATNGPPNLAHDVFSFVRIKYDSTGGRNESWYYFEERIWQRWETDYPRGGQNLLFRLAELTSLKVNPEPIVIRLTDESLFRYPFIFMSDVGWQQLRTTERLRLKQYLENGGFLWVDDFWGQAEWDNWEFQSTREAPEWRWVDIPTSHPIMNTVYPLKECPQIPARSFYVRTGQHFDPHWLHRKPNGGDADLSQVHFRGLFDRKGRLMAVATHNTDIADGWEREGEGKDYFDKFSVHAYALAINVLTYVMTH